jgi:hypothetical protein
MLAASRQRNCRLLRLVRTAAMDAEETTPARMLPVRARMLETSLPPPHSLDSATVGAAGDQPVRRHTVDLGGRQFLCAVGTASGPEWDGAQAVWAVLGGWIGRLFAALSPGL